MYSIIGASRSMVGTLDFKHTRYFLARIGFAKFYGALMLWGMWLQIIYLLAGLTLLALGGDLLVRGAVRVSRLLKFSTAIAGLTIVAFGTSAPEFVVSFIAAFQKSSDIAVANVVGSNIFNIGMILGLCAIIRPLAVSKTTIRQEWPILLVCSGLAIVFFRNGALERMEGTIFLGLLVGFLWWMVRSARHQRKTHDLAQPDAAAAPVHKGREAGYSALWIVSGSLLLVVGARLMVTASIDIAEALGVSQRVIGLTIVGAGTGLPELAASVMAGIRRHDDIAIGNIIGSNILNLLWVLGCSSLVYPLRVDPAIVHFDNWWMLGITVLLLPLMWIGYRVRRFGGVILLGAYVSYLFFIFVR